MNPIDREIQGAAEWLQREAARIPFGSVAVTLTLHRGVVSRIEHASSVSLKPETGDANDRAR